MIIRLVLCVIEHSFVFCKPCNFYLIRKILSIQQSINNHIYCVGDSIKSEGEKEEKWRSILNHIVNIHKHDDNKIFTECLHGTLEREWLKQGW